MMAQAAPKNAAGLQALRFLLGLAEGSASPAFVVMISLWYRYVPCSKSSCKTRSHTDITGSTSTPLDSLHYTLPTS